MSLGVTLSLVMVVVSATGAVPLATIHAQPGAYEDKVVETCGEFYGGDALFLRGWISGRSRGAIRLTRTMRQHGYICVRAQVVRLLEPEPRPTGLVIVDHPTVTPDGWRLRVIRVLSRDVR